MPITILQTTGHTSFKSKAAALKSLDAIRIEDTETDYRVEVDAVSGRALIAIYDDGAFVTYL